MLARLPLSSLRLLRPSRAVALAAVPALLVATPARADECASDSDCGFGFACETVVTSSASAGTGGVGGASSGAPAGSGFGASAGTTGLGGTTGFGGGSSTGGLPPAGGTGSAPPPTACGNAFCETPTESPELCPSDCVYTTVCATATCTSDSQCAPGYVCPTPGSVGTGGGPNVPFCGDLLCSPGEDCAVDCDPSYRRCSPGLRGCQTNADCGPGYQCQFLGGGGSSGAGGAPSTGGTAGFGEGGAPAEAPEPAAPRGGSVFTGGTSGWGGAGGGAGIATARGTDTGTTADVGAAGGGAVPQGGSAGYPGDGTCVPTGTGGTSGGTGGDDPGGTAGVGAIGGSARGGTGATGDNGGTFGEDDDGDGESRTIVTHGGCSLATESGSTSFAALLVAAVALLRVGRRRAARR